MRFAFVAAIFVAACSPTIGDDDAGDAESPFVNDAVDTDLGPVTEVASTAPHLEAFFAVPKQDGTGDGALETKIIELINGTPKGARIRISMYGFTRVAVADALGNAYDRKVDVQVVLDEEENLRVKKATAKLAQQMPTLTEDEVDEVDNEDVDAAGDDDLVAKTTAASKYNDGVAELFKRLPDAKITLCKRGRGSCIGGGIDHNKIYMFSTTGGAHKVVVQSSANLTTHHLHNNLVISRGDADLYDGYVHYFEDLQKKKENLNYYRSESGNHTIAYHYPRASGDTIVSILNNVRCSNKTHHTVYVAMAFFTQSRHAIADRLSELAADGCDVRVNMRHAGQDSDQSIINILKRKTDIKTYPDAHGTNIHSKYLIVDAAYVNADGDKPVRQLVWTGSHNYTGGALRNNDETLLRVDDKGVFDAFVANWKTMRAQM